MSKRTEDLFQKVYEPRSKEEQAAAYSEWAETYDAAMSESGYVSPPKLAALLRDHCDDAAIILDVGCGTGLSGEALAGAGLTTFDGIDISSGMLAEAAVKGIYRRLFEVDLVKGIPVEDGQYDAAFSTGTFTLGHVGPTQIPEVMRVLKSGGVFCLTVSDLSWDDQNYAEQLPSLGAGIFKIISDEIHDHVRDHNMQAHFLVLEKL